MRYSLIIGRVDNDYLAVFTKYTSDDYSDVKTYYLTYDNVVKALYLTNSATEIAYKITFDNDQLAVYDIYWNMVLLSKMDKLN